MISTKFPVSTSIRRIMAVVIFSCITNASLWGVCRGRVSSGPTILVGTRRGFNSMATITWLRCRIWAFLYQVFNSLLSISPMIIAIIFVFQFELSFSFVSISRRPRSVPFPDFKKRFSHPWSANSWRAFLSSRHSEIVCLESSWYSQYLFLLLNLVGVSMGPGRFSIGLPLISLRILRGLVWNRLALSSSFLRCLFDCNSLSSPTLFQVSYRTKSFPSRISIAWIKS